MRQLLPLEHLQVPDIRHLSGLHTRDASLYKRWSRTRMTVMVQDIADLSLDEVIARLIAGDTLQVAGGDPFTLASTDSRAILGFYNQDRRSYWNPDKDTNIQDGEVDKVLAALDQTPKGLSGNK